MSQGIDANEVINNLLQQVGEQAQQIAMLRVQLAISAKQEDTEEGGSE